MIDRYQQGRVRPAAGAPGRLAALAHTVVAGYSEAMDRFALQDGAAGAYRLVDAANEFIAETSPWALAKDPANGDRLNAVLHEAAEAVRIAAVLLLPMMPRSAAEILRRLGEQRPAAEIRLDDAAWSTARERHVLKGDALWPRSDGGDTAAPTTRKGSVTDETKTAPPASSTDAPAPSSSAPAPATVAPPSPPTEQGSDKISIDEFMKVDLRVARITAAERVPKSKKLVKLSVDVGYEQRTLVAGIGDAYEPDALVGKTIAIVANLKPAKLMGIESNGMVLAGSPEGGLPTLATFDPSPPLGSRVR
jgi:methionyl-tRNA synthetase